MIIPLNIDETKRNNILIPINGLQFSTFLINFLHFIVLLSEIFLISSVSTSYSTPINLANFLLSIYNY